MRNQDENKNIKNINSDSGNAANSAEVEKKSGDIEFDTQYTKAFEEKLSNDNQYRIDESLKSKREARYDETFSNMTDDEKIKALEAARLARKEKRDKLAAKKAEGGFIGSFISDKIKSKDDEKPSKTKNSVRDGEKAERTKSFSAKPKQKTARPERDSRKRFKLSPKVGIAVGIAVAIVVVSVIIASVYMASNAAKGYPEVPTIYEKDNSLYSNYNGKTSLLSSNFIDLQYEDITNEPTASPGRGSSAATPAPVSEQLKEKELINYTDNGQVTYFIDNTDMNAKSGSLQYVKNGKKDSSVKIADNVYYDITITGDGGGVLYLTDADEFGNGGMLNYWSSLTKNSVKISPNVNIGNFVFAQTGNGIAYINEYNNEHNVGNLYLAAVNKSGAVEQAKRIESDVYKVYGTNPGGRTVVYSKNFNPDDNCFEVYMMKMDSDSPVMIVDGSRCEPILAKNSEHIYLGGSYEEYYQTLYYASLEDGNKEKISSGLTEIIKVSKDEQAVVFRKSNMEGTMFEYYYAHQTGSEGQVLAANVTVLDDEKHKRASQFEIDDEFTKAVFIEDFDPSIESGGLFTVSIANSIVGSDKKISDTAYSCNITPDGTVIRYADQYDLTWNLVTINAYSNDKTTVLAKEVGYESFTFDANGLYTVYAKNYNMDTRSGDVYCVDNKARTKEVTKEAGSYGLKKNGQIVFGKRVDETKLNMFCAKPNGSRPKDIGTGVTKILSY